MKTVFYALSAFVALGLASCSDNDENPIPMDKDNSMKVTMALDYASGRAARTGEMASFAANDECGLFVCEGALGTNYRGVATNNNNKFTFDGAKWTTADRILLDETPALVYGYYPYSSEATDASAIKVTSATQYDYLYSGTAVTASVNQTDVKLMMKHAMSKVVFSVIKDASYEGTGLVSGVKIKNMGAGKEFSTSGTMNISNGALDGLVSGDQEFAANNTITDTATRFEAIVMPMAQTTAADVQVIFTIDGTDYQFTFPVGTEWQQGKRNIYTLTVKKTTLTLADNNGDGTKGVIIEPWTDSETTAISLVPVI